jgi:hypothetical protein
MDSIQMLAIIVQYCRKADSEDKDIKVTRVADKKSVFVEQVGDDGRAVMLSEYIVDGVKYCAGYISRSQTIYISRVA